MKKKIVILGAAGRDFHNFNMAFRGNSEERVVAFTATQIPSIDDRIYPAALAGAGYPDGIPIVPEEELEDLIRREDVDEVVFAYSDVSHDYVMHLASRVMAAGADFRLLGDRRTMVRSSRPVVSITAVRTGCGKSQTSRAVARLLLDRGLRVVSVRHPMPYGDLYKQRVQRFASYEDMIRHGCTIEEIEEYEHYVENGMVVFAGVDYEAILKEAEKEADVILWDGGNNDTPFYAPDLDIVVADPLRPGHELAYHPGEANLRRAQVIVLNKMNTATEEQGAAVMDSILKVNPSARILRADSEVVLEEPEQVKGKRVLVVEDGPTVTHGGMSFGAGVVAARQWGAAELVDPRPYAQGSIREAYEKYPHMERILPALGYFPEQLKDLQETIDRVDCDLVIIGTPVDLRRYVPFKQTALRVTYGLKEWDGDLTLASLLDELPLPK